MSPHCRIRGAHAIAGARRGATYLLGAAVHLPHSDEEDLAPAANGTVCHHQPVLPSAGEGAAASDRAAAAYADAQISQPPAGRSGFVWMIGPAHRPHSTWNSANTRSCPEQRRLALQQGAERCPMGSLRARFRPLPEPRSHEPCWPSTSSTPASSPRPLQRRWS